MTLKAAEAIKMMLDEGAARITCTRIQRTRGIVHSRGKTAWREYRPCRSGCGRATTYWPSPRWQKCASVEREEWSRQERQGQSGQWGPSGAQGTTGENG